MNKNIKNKTNKIIIAIIIVTLCNFVMPKLSFASVDLNGGKFFKPIAQFIAWLADISIKMLQTVAIGDGTVKVYNSEYLIRYSPGIIFSGKIPMFDINFISPQEDYQVQKMVVTYENQIYTFEELKVEDNPYVLLDRNGIYYNFMKTGELKDAEGNLIIKRERYNGSDSDFDSYQYDWEKDFNKDSPSKGGQDVIYILEEAKIETTEQTEMFPEYIEGIIWPNEIDATERDEDGFSRVTNVYYKGVFYEELYVGYKAWEKLVYRVNEEVYVNVEYYIIDLTPENNLDKEYAYEGGIYEHLEPDAFELVETGETISSIAVTLKPFVATWYNVFKVVALVALLVVLVYVAIRMILSSTSKDKAKYKKMLIDWVTAVIIIFVMQYIISLIFAVTGAITDFFSESVVGEYGQDILMSDIRTSIGAEPPDFMTVFARIVMYVVLVIFTILFTIQYLKRTIYMAFLTLISPLVAFTYPLDKLKDGKAQAFSAWLREFIYTALVQPVHLIVYCLLVNSAIDLSTRVPIYAIMVIGFLLPAEKFVKKMFGLDRANTVGSMASAFGGAAIMNGINKLGLNGPKGKKGQKGENGGSGEGGNNAPVRTANEGQEDPYDVLKEDSQDGSDSGGPLGGDSDNGPNMPTQDQNDAKKKRKIKNKTGRIAGLKNVAKKYVLNKNTPKSILRGGAKLAGAATLGTIGLAAGIATGDMENAFAGALGGIAAGGRVGSNLVDRGENLINGVSDGINDIRDAYGEGAYGKDEYARMKFDKEFKQSAEYINLIDKYPGKENDVQEFLNAGITDAKMMQKAIDKKYSTREAIAYMKMAQAEDCPNEVLYDREKFKTYIEARGIPASKAEEIRKGIIDFK